MIVPRYYEDLSVLHENTMPPRAYYMPASKRMDDLTEHREKSDRLQLLNGNWKFRYFESIYDVKESFYETDYDVSDFDEMRVPGIWQMEGYDMHQYTNIRYPFPFDPPYVPQDIPCGAYVHTFFYQSEKTAPKAYLNFEGVDSCFYVWLNGKYVGYSQISHAVSEFDVTSFLKDGENIIAVLVLKWCDGSYLEDQDKFRMSGIFRDVYILKRPERAVCDYRITTEVSKEVARIKLDIQFYQPIHLNIRVEDKNGAVVSQGTIEKDGIIEFEIFCPVFWNTENPYLYTVILESKYEVIVDAVALRTIEIYDKVIYFNGEKIKFRGVNRHDSEPETGVVGAKQIKTDMILMKQHNFNAIRSSHYPNAPYFYQMCDKYGFIVIDEADIEAHGPFMLYRKEDTDYNRFSRWNEKIADDPAWEQSILDRVQRMIQRDKNRFCIVMWSMGNESAYGCNFEKALEWTKTFDPARLTQYESARYRNYNVTYQYHNLDLYSRMYPSLEEIEEYLEKDGSKPFLLVEYCHSMGNGPGDFEDYFQMIQSDDRICGGFVWEWCDHAVKTESGFLYGGDFGEELHDGNFCVDGLVSPNRIPHPGLREFKNVYRPARIQSADWETGAIVFKNYMDFTDLKDYVYLKWEAVQDGIIIEESIQKELPSVLPHTCGTVYYTGKLPENGSCFLRVRYLLKSPVPGLKEGWELGFDEAELPEAVSEKTEICGKEKLPETGRAALILDQTERRITVTGKDFTYVYDTFLGVFSEIKKGEKEYLTHPMEYNIWRAPTDNDRKIRLEWERAGYDRTKVRTYTTEARLREDGSAELVTELSLSAVHIQRILNIKASWLIHRDGCIQVKLDVKKDMEFPFLPRFGLRLFLDQSLDRVRYCGMGPDESYPDKHQASWHGIFEGDVRTMHRPYLKPQEYGSHWDCSWCEISGEEMSFQASSKEGFMFQACEYTQEELSEKAHDFELKEVGCTVLCLDHNQSGIGSGSCGPQLLEKYQFNEPEFSRTWVITPGKRKE